MSETFAWPEGNVYLSTGTATASALVVFAESVQATFTHGWDNFATLDGNWHDVLTGERADVMIGTLHTVDNSALRAFAAAKTGVHMHLRFDTLGVSAGYLLYSGRFDLNSLAGRNGQVAQFNVTYHANKWSAYG